MSRAQAQKQNDANRESKFLLNSMELDYDQRNDN